MRPIFNRTDAFFAHDNPAHHHENTNCVGMSNERSEGILPCRTFFAGRDLEGKCFPHLGRHGLGPHVARDASYE